MRRCPLCQAPNPDAAPFCRSCGGALPALPARPRRRFFGFRGPAARRLLWAALPALLFQISAGRLLGVGLQRQEWHFLVFHAVHGLILGLSLAWLWSGSRPKDWALWAAGGLAGGILAEGLEVWFTYRHWMGFLSLRLWVDLGFPENPALTYELLQMLRLAGPFLCLGWVRLRRGAGPGSWARLLLGGAAALALRGGVRGAWVTWNTFAAALGWEHAFLCGLSLLAFFWALGPPRE